MNAWMEASARISLSTANRLIGEEDVGMSFIQANDVW